MAELAGALADVEGELDVRDLERERLEPQPGGDGLVREAHVRRRRARGAARSPPRSSSRRRRRGRRPCPCASAIRAEFYPAIRTFAKSRAPGAGSARRGDAAAGPRPGRDGRRAPPGGAGDAGGRRVGQRAEDAQRDGDPEQSREHAPGLFKARARAGRPSFRGVAREAWAGSHAGRGSGATDAGGYCCTGRCFWLAASCATSAGGLRYTTTSGATGTRRPRGRTP